MSSRGPRWFLICCFGKVTLKISSTGKTNHSNRSTTKDLERWKEANNRRTYVKSQSTETDSFTQMMIQRHLSCSDWHWEILKLLKSWQCAVVLIDQKQIQINQMLCSSNIIWTIFTLWQLENIAKGVYRLIHDNAPCMWLAGPKMSQENITQTHPNPNLCPFSSSN